MTDRRTFDITERIEERDPTDRVRGTVVNVTTSGMFVVKYDNGDYLAYQPEDAEGFEKIPDKPMPRHAADLIHALRQKLGRIPPEDAMILSRRRAHIPGQGTKPPVGVDPALTPEDQPPSIEA
jgi:hypothetical protein